MPELNEAAVNAARAAFSAHTARGSMRDRQIRLAIEAYLAAAAIKPRDEGWVHFGCQECGRVQLLPADREEEGPWCTHGGAASYVWGGPDCPDEPPGSLWTPMLRVTVLRGPSAP